MTKLSKATMEVLHLPEVEVNLGVTARFTALVSYTPFTVPGTQAQAYGLTRCELRHGKRRVSGVAYCSMKDGFVAAKGRKVALADALRQVKSKAKRRAVWDSARISGVV